MINEIIINDNKEKLTTLKINFKIARLVLSQKIINTAKTVDQTCLFMKTNYTVVSSDHIHIKRIKKSKTKKCQP